MKVLFSHDWLNGMRGGEKCLEQLLFIYPNAEIVTLLADRSKLSEQITKRPIHTSFLQKLPWSQKKYQWYLPIFPWAISSLPKIPADMIISTSHCVAKGMRKKNSTTPHLCYCFTPMRYAWLFFDEYFGHYPFWLKPILKIILSFMRAWDVKRSKDVNYFVAISHHIRKRIEKFYHREAVVIYPPVNTDFYCLPTETKPRHEYLLVSALVPYKRVDLAIKAFNELRLPLTIIGNGPERKRLEDQANSNIQFLGWMANEQIREHYQSAKALLFPGEEDFGIVPVEAQACGCPVIAYQVGGALETVVAGKTGVFFKEQSVKSICDAVQRLSSVQWDETIIRSHAEKFSEERFRNEIKGFVEQKILQKNEAKDTKS